jgi:hypothetical protein
LRTAVYSLSTFPQDGKFVISILEQPAAEWLTGPSSACYTCSLVLDFFSDPADCLWVPAIMSVIFIFPSLPVVTGLQAMDDDHSFTGVPSIESFAVLITYLQMYRALDSTSACDALGNRKITEIPFDWRLSDLRFLRLKLKHFGDPQTFSLFFSVVSFCIYIINYSITTNTYPVFFHQSTKVCM